MLTLVRERTCFVLLVLCVVWSGCSLAKALGGRFKYEVCVENFNMGSVMSWSHPGNCPWWKLGMAPYLGCQVSPIVLTGS